MTRYAKAPSARLSGLLLVLIGILFAPASAAALTSHEFKSSFGSAGSGAGQLELSGRSGVAVNQATHNVYVADTNNHRVSEFSEAGTFIRAFGADVGGAGVNVCTTTCQAGTASSSPGGLEAPTFVAVDNSAGGKGDVYVANIADSFVTKYEADGTLVTSWGTGGQLSGPGVGEFFGGIAGIAVDSAGTLDVFNTGTQMFEFGSGGTFLTTFTTARETAALGLAVDPDGNFFKVNGDFSVEKFEASGSDRGQVNSSFTTTGIATDASNGELFVNNGAAVNSYAFNGSEEVLQSGAACLPKPFEGCPATVSFGDGSLTATAGLGVDGSSGTVYIADSGAAHIAVFTPITLPDASTEAPTAVTGESATLHGTVGAAGGPEASCEFQYISEEAFLAAGKSFQGATSLDCTPPGPFTGSVSEAVSAPLTNLTPGTSYCFRVLAESANGANPGTAVCFLTLGPTVVSTNATSITTTAATLTGFVNPHGKPFSYHVDYGPTASYGSSIPVPDAAAEATPIATANITFGFKKVEGVVMSQGVFAVGQDIVGEGIPAGTTVTAVEGSTLTLSDFPAGSGSVSLTSTTVFVSQPLSGLTPGTEYHARLVATNADATYLGPDRGFATYPVDTGLPDGRTYEMVSPALKIGQVFPPEPSGALGGSCSNFCLPGISDVPTPMQSSPDGDAVAFEGQPFSTGLAARGNEYLSRRSSSGWTTQPITPPLAASGAADGYSGFKALSADLSRGVLFQSKPALSPQAPIGEGGRSYNNLYFWESGTSNLQPLVTVKPPNRLAGNSGSEEEEVQFELAFAGANSGGAGVPAFEHLIFEANDALTPAVPTIAPEAPEVVAGRCAGFPPKENCNLYEWVGGQLRLINVLPGNIAAATHAVIGSGRRLARALGSHTDPSSQSPGVDHAISADGSKIFWSDESGQVFVRIEGKETLEVKDPGQFLTASVDGSKVLLSDGCLYDVQAESCEASLSDTPAGFYGTLGASEDLSTIYFVSTEALTEAASPGTCEKPLNGPGRGEEAEGKVPAGFGCNVYAYDEGEVSLVTTLNEQDNNFGDNSTYGDWKASKSNRTAQVSPDGNYLTFMSYGSLTGYDNRVVDASQCGAGAQGILCFEVYQYDLEGKSLSCPSCNPSGQRPVGRSNLSLISQNSYQASLPQPENLPADTNGRLFFESQDVLTTADTNGHIQDVYEWTPNEVGSCKRAAGCIALISSGHSSVDSFFLDSTPSGNDTFFITREQLLPRDKDDQLDLYDARVGGGIDEPLNLDCLGKACRGPGTLAPSETSPGSATFQSPPPPKPCKKGFVKKRGKCAKKSSRKHHKRAVNHNGGGSK